MSEFDKNLRTTQCMGGGIEVETTVIVDGKIKQLFKKYDLNVPEAVEQFKKDFEEYRYGNSQPRTKLYTIIYERLDDGRSVSDIRAFNTVGVDMDEGTAVLLAINDYKSGFAIEGTDDEELSDDFFKEELGDIHWLECPDEIDNFEITVKEI